MSKFVTDSSLLLAENSKMLMEHPKKAKNEKALVKMKSKY